MLFLLLPGSGWITVGLVGGADLRQDIFQSWGGFSLGLGLCADANGLAGKGTDFCNEKLIF